MKKILKMIKPLDWIIAVVGSLLILQIDFNNVHLEDIIYMTVMIMWFGMLVMRLWIQWCKS